ncbi:hypothetical protein [Rhodobacter sp. CZR27]|uniref:hypothetical protein n=1 Tax=Rhodobacter sp. CZR27 TaxID=2033869 RepID=UPI0012FE0AEA|nr:hypothetical protein [Rhodobacter sp. CZR27]
MTGVDFKLGEDAALNYGLHSLRHRPKFHTARDLGNSGTKGAVITSMALMGFLRGRLVSPMVPPKG